MKQFQLIFFTLLIYLYVLGSKAHAELVEKINVIGNERITSETIIVFGDIKKAQNYEAEDINILIKKLYDTTFFSNIVIELKDGVLNIQVKENPIINSIIFKGIKDKKYKDALSDYLGLKEKSSFIKNAVKHDVKIIRDFYRAQGFYFVDVEVEIEQLEGKWKVGQNHSVADRRSAAAGLRRVGGSSRLEIAEAMIATADKESQSHRQ